MDMTVNWIHGMEFRAATASGHTLVMDASETSGGANAGPRPTELLVASIGGCTGMDIVSILEKMQQPVEGVAVQIEGKRATEHPRRFTKFHLHYVITGTGLSPERVGRAVQLSTEKYCTVAHSLNADIDYDFEIVGA